ncbi:N-acetylmuramidase family protein [Desulfovibrio cuneatus]|uniref:N-acetylmuramidase family protein n=1 Tax=Desulfovibrio cuneatus TaxID=159728 RepID=UPI000421E5B9|nr:N-acetylmuramidase family protein [Desulfovibrio cuneatus]
MPQPPLTWEDITRAAADLGIEPCTMQAVCTVESAGNGFLPSGRAKILFEGHIFWRELKKRGVPPEDYAEAHPTVLYPKWTKAHYLGGEKEHDRLNEAKNIQEEAALASASWGAFQIMGFNHAACGYATVREFVHAQEQDPITQLEAFCGFIRTNNLVRHLKNHDWAAFAKGYNGPGYGQNRYDEKLAGEYAKCLERSAHG